MGFACYLHATAPWGYWYTVSNGVGTRTNFTADQLTQLSAILTTPPTMYHTYHGTGVTATNPTFTVVAGLPEVEN
jgi:hypothetical protein